MHERKNLLIRLLEHLESAVQLMDEHPAKPDDADTIFQLVDTARETAEVELNCILLAEAGIILPE
jgi:hypothetical protein